MPLATLADAPRFERGGFVFRSLAVPSRGSAELAVWQLELPPGGTSEAHEISCEEVLVVVEGRVAATVAGEELLAAAGDAIVVPAGAELRVANPDADRPARATVATSAAIEARIGGQRLAPPWAQ